MSADSCQQILDELGPRGPTEAGKSHAETCESCRALLEVHQRMQLEGSVNASSLERARAAAKAELAAHPKFMSWKAKAAIFAGTCFFFGLVVLKLFGAGLPPLSNHAFDPWGLLAVAEIGLAVGALVPGRQSRIAGAVGLLLALLAAVAVVLGLVPVALPMTAGAATCSSLEVGIAVLPLAVGFWALRDASPSRFRALLAGVGAGAVGQMVLHVICPNTTLAHVATFHFGAWLLVAVLAAFVLTLGRPRSYAP